MIDPNAESVLSLTQAAKTLPARRAGKRPHVSCLYRWAKTGCKGVILETLQVGGTRCTSREALARFFQRLTDLAGVSSSTASSARQGLVDQAEHELNAEGI